MNRYFNKIELFNYCIIRKNYCLNKAMPFTIQYLRLINTKPTHSITSSSITDLIISRMSVHTKIGRSSYKVIRIKYRFSSDFNAPNGEKCCNIYCFQGCVDWFRQCSSNVIRHAARRLKRIRLKPILSAIWLFLFLLSRDQQKEAWVWDSTLKFDPRLKIATL